MKRQALILWTCIALTVIASVFAYRLSGTKYKSSKDLADQNAATERIIAQTRVLETEINKLEQDLEQEKHSTNQPPLPDPSDTTITKKLVDTYIAEGKALHKAGRYSEALRIYLWCYDATGIAKTKGYNGIRNDSLLESIVEIGEYVPEAFDALRTRNEEAERRIREGSKERQAFLNYVSINRKTGNSVRSLKLYDDPTLDEGAKRRLQSHLRDHFIDARRYTDATSPGTYGMNVSMFETRDRTLTHIQKDKSLPPEAIKAIKESIHRGAINRAARDIEALVGSGEIEDGMALAAKVLKADITPETIELLNTHLKRAGHADLLETILLDQIDN